LAPQDDPRDHPALLVSYYYWKNFAKQRARYGFRDYILDSGAFSAMNSGKTIDLVEYTERAGELLRTDPQCTEVVALDVVADWKQSRRNLEWMWSRGVPATPCFHIGAPWHELQALVKQYPKVNVGQLVPLARKPKTLARVLDTVFAHTWKAAGGPYPLHGLGCVSEKVLMGWPFDSVDASSWELGPCAFGRWQVYGDMSVRGGSQDLRAEVEWYLRLERRAQHRWRKVLKQARERQ
jgi:hypothetical protein